MNFDDNRAALQVIRFINGTNRNVFLTGKAGTGKTTLLKEIVANTHKEVVIVAPTGIAALNAGGVTIHSMFQLPPSCFAPALTFTEDEIPFAVMPLKKVPHEVSKMSSWKRDVLRSMELLVIDEVSMLRADLLDAIDVALRHIRFRRDAPFGGVQVLFIGDMLQLPPVVRNDEWNFLKQFYPSMYFFDALALRGTPPLLLELEKIYRQDDRRFVEILNNLRDNRFVPKDVNELNRHYIPGFSAPKKEPYIFITTHNKKANAINDANLRKLKTESKFFEAEVVGNFPESMYPITPTMELKAGAQVMFIKNDPHEDKRYYNGKIGTVHEFATGDDGSENIIVIFEETGETVMVEKYTWENIRYSLDKSTGQIEEEVIGSFTHFPLKLAWAVTVHKSQGLTFKRAIIDVSEAFAPGQIYVALSRLESLGGLVLSEPIVDDYPDQDQRVVDFTNVKHDEAELNDIFHRDTQRYVTTQILSSYSFDHLHDIHTELLSNFDDVDETSKSPKKKFKADVVSLSPKIEHIIDIARKFSVQLQNLINHKDTKKLQERVQASVAYFAPLFEEISTEIYGIVANAMQSKGTKGMVTDLESFELSFFKTEQKIKKCLRMLESVNEGKAFTKENIEPDVDLAARKKIFLQRAKKKKARSSAEKYSEQKYDTKEISFLMFNDGLTIEEIAAERGLRETTIGKHLEYYLAEGQIDVADLVPEEEIQAIARTARELRTKSIGEIHAATNCEYQTIRFVLAAMEGGNW